MKKKFKKRRVFLLSIPFIALIFMQFVKPDNTYVAIEKEKLALPEEVEAILRSSCFDCHSNESNLKWFDKITPVNWIVAQDIKKARTVLNFSDWDKLPEKAQSAKLYYSLNKILSNEMPLKSYRFLHDAEVSESEIDILRNYITSRTPRKIADSNQIRAAEIQANILKGEKASLDPNFVKPVLNGIKYIPNYKNWRAISTTDRFDNGTMRIIYGNDIAVQAIKQKRTNPWPDGSIIAKVAWKEQIDDSGNISTGEFLQVEYMIRDEYKYADTKGWGWARWRGNDLKPYGENANFANECIRCHNPVKNNDYMFTIPLNLNINNLGISKK